jgi:hypothetical protein
MKNRDVAKAEVLKNRHSKWGKRYPIIFES